ncbi:MAG: 5-(carboxyamino)imidazole ribonucleotide mutase [Armatimonadota bacterium]
MNPLVAFVCGSDSDLPKLEAGLQILKDFGIPFEVRIISAHRTPEATVEFAKTAEERGLRVLVAVAGHAAHLGGVLASLTTLPVIGIPISSSALDGLDSLMSTVQMPPGVPVASVGIDAARNAAIFAAQILGASDPAIREKIREFKRRQAEDVMAKDRRVREQYS